VTAALAPRKATPLRRQEGVVMSMTRCVFTERDIGDFFDQSLHTPSSAVWGGLLKMPEIARMTSKGPFGSTILAACNEVNR